MNRYKNEVWKYISALLKKWKCTALVKYDKLDNIEADKIQIIDVWSDILKLCVLLQSIK